MRLGTSNMSATVPSPWIVAPARPALLVVAIEALDHHLLLRLQLIDENGDPPSVDSATTNRRSRCRGCRLDVEDLMQRRTADIHPVLEQLGVPADRMEMIRRVAPSR